MRRGPLDGRGKPADPRGPGEAAPAAAESPAPAEGEALAPAEGEAVASAGVEAGPATGPDYQDRWLRAEAELQNYRRRVAREIDAARRSAEEAVLLELFPWLDDLERALEAARQGGADATWTQGIELVAQRAREVIARQGIEAIDPAGQPFDPALHEAVLEIDAPEGAAPGHVVQVLHKGYRRGERVVRPARVVVAREPRGAQS